MANLLTNAEKIEVKAAFKDVTDTFYTTPIVYKNMSDTFSRMGNVNNSSPTTINLLGRVTVKETEKNEAEQSLEGIDDKQNIEIRFNSADLRTAGAMTGLNLADLKMDVHKDYLNWDGKDYLLKMIGTDDTDFAGEIIIIVCTCERLPVKA